MSRKVTLDNHYDILGVPANASVKDIKKAYRTLCRSLHPDKNKFGAALFRKVNDAHEVLSDPISRKAYDRDPNTAPASGGVDGILNRNIRQSITCPVCHEIVATKFVELTCCGRLSCLECIQNQGSCPSCDKYLTNKSSLRKKSSKFVKNLIEQIATPHSCGRYVCFGDSKRHNLVCPVLNTVCFKCSGKGRFYDAASDKILRCDGCHGLKILSGKDWRICFKCKGRGAVDKANTATDDCATCDGKGGLEGRWTVCFKCQGNGTGGLETPTGRTDCTACCGAGAFNGYNLEECQACKGYGCKACELKGSVRCQCGSECPGHSDKYTPRHTYASYNSDTEDDMSTNGSNSI
jgi:DnaJ domain